jgi:hypothetical protein
MLYSLSLLTTWAQCDAVTAYATAKQKMLTYHDNQTDHRAENLTTSAGNVASELTGLNAYITAMTPVILTLPAGKDRSKQENDLRLKTDRRDSLVARQGQVGPEALVESELDGYLIDLQVPGVQDLLDQVARHRLTLTS